MKTIRTIVSLVAFIAVFTANVYAEELPLFASAEVIDIVFEAPMTTIIRNAEKRPGGRGRHALHRR